MQKLNRQSGIAPIIILIIVLGLIGAGGSVVYVKNKNKRMAAESPTPTASPEGMMKARTVTVKMEAQNDSGNAGEAVLTEIEGGAKVKVVLSVSGAPTGVAQPAHIHGGSCPLPGGVLYPLTPVMNGASQTEIETTLGELLEQLPLSINVHKSQVEAAIYVACGDITADGMMMGEEMGKNPELKEFTMTSWYEMTNGQPSTHFSLNEIRVKKGDMVKIRVTNTNGSHDFSLDEYGIKRLTPLNQQVTIEFKADQAGTFKYYCSMPGHRAMGQEGTLIVEE